MEDPQVTAWLAELGLERYGAAFAEAEIDFETLADLTVADLRELGLDAIGPRRRVENAIARLRADRATSAGAPAFIEARRHLSILFCDVVGSTAISQRFNAEQMSVMFREYYAVVTAVVSRNGGHEANRLGDGSLIFFGYPQAQEHAALQAAVTAQEIIDEVARLVTDPGGTPLKVRAGIASGMVVLNHADTKNVFGETANIAARVQALAGPGEVVVADGTRRLLRDLVRLEPRGEHTLKGIEKPMAVWLAVPTADGPGLAAAAPAPAMPLVGRDAELDRVTELWRAVRSGHGQRVYVTGDAGLGKSHFTAALAEHVASDGGQRRLFRCFSETVNSPFSPFLREFQAEVDNSAIDPDLAAALEEPKRDESLTVVRDRRESLIGGFTRRALARAGDGPLLLCVEDVHWSDPSSLEVLARLVAAVENEPVLLLITSRDTEGLPGIEGGTTLPLSPLGLEDTKRVVAATIEALELATPESLITEIAARADGVPFFAAELALSFAQASSTHTDAPASVTDVPVSLQEALQYRVDGLAVGTEVLHLAAAFGRELPMNLLRALVPNERTLEAALSELSAAGLLTLAAPGQDGAPENLMFRHQLVLEYAYDTILSRDRSALHGRIADVLAGRPETGPHICGHHEQLAGRLEAAARSWAAAGRRAASRSADAEAAAYFRRALELVPEFADARTSEEFETEVLLAFLPTLMSSDGYVSAATVSVNRVVELTAKRSQPDQAFNALFLRWLGHLGRGQIDVAHGLGLEMKMLAAQIATDISSLLIDRMMGTTHMFRGELAAASDALERFASLYDPSRHAAALSEYGATDNYTTVQCCRICVAVLMGDLETPGSLQLATAAEAEKLGRIHNLCHVLAYGGALGSALHLDWDGMARYTDRLDDISSTQELPFWQAAVSFFRGIEAAHSGDVAGGRERFEAGVQWCTGQGVGFLLPTLKLVFASAAGIEAVDPTEFASIDANLRDGERWLRPELLRLWADQLFRHGATANGTALLVQSVELAQKQGAVILAERAASMLDALG